MYIKNSSIDSYYFVQKHSLEPFVSLCREMKRCLAWQPSEKWMYPHGMTTPLPEISAKTRRNLGETATVESSMIVLIEVFETLDFTGSIELQQAQIPMVVLQTSC